MAGGGGERVTQTQSIPDWLEAPVKANIAEAERISARPYEAYGGRTVAGYNPAQRRAYDLAQSSVGAANPYISSAYKMMQSAAGYQPQQVGVSNVGYGAVTAPGFLQPQQVGSYNTGYDAVTAPGFFQPEQVGASNAGYDAVESVDFLQPQQVSASNAGFDAVSAPNFLQGDVAKYMNPYTQNVIDASMKDLQGANNLALQQINQQASGARAFGGSRQGVAEALQRSQAAQGAGRMSADLRNQSYNQASATMQADQARQMQANMANQQAGMTTSLANQQAQMQAALANQNAGMTAGSANQQAQMQSRFANQQAGMTTGLANQQAQLAAALANQQAGMTAGSANQQALMQAALANQQAGLTAGSLNQGAQMQAALANQQAGIGASGQRLTAANSLAGLGAQAQAANQVDISQLTQAGMLQQQQMQSWLDDAYRRWAEERNYPIEGLNMRIGATSSAPVPMSSTQTSKSSFNPMSLISPAIGIANMFAGSDERMKTDISRLPEPDEETGLPLYAYRYKGDPKSYPKVVGPMAQDIQEEYPDEVKKIGGRLAVNLGFGPMQRTFG